MNTMIRGFNKSRNFYIIKFHILYECKYQIKLIDIKIRANRRWKLICSTLFLLMISIINVKNSDLEIRILDLNRVVDRNNLSIIANY